ncbi:MAG: sigma-54 dependent transcriptional regulator [Acidobacteriia bacterium]|nr:sigma-54 dependent transcriptional regulator [Terriglobia bacterium]
MISNCFAELLQPVVEWVRRPPNSLHPPLKVLIVDDEASQRSGMAAMVSAWDMTAETAAEGNEALQKLEVFPADVILTDLNMPGLDGFGFMQRLRDSGDMPPTIVLTAFGNIETAVRTVHELGAYWFLEKPIQPGTLEVLIRRAGSHAGLRTENRNLERQLSYKGSLGELVGTSPGIQEIFALLQQAGPSKACVLITGESGTGKELVARTIHALSPRRQGPFIAINCAALPETLIESELFGHEKGSFTGASERRAGCFEIAQHGTLLLDEIGEMPMQTQAKLLRILEDSKVRRLGGKTEFEVDVRLVAATNKEPEEAVRSGHLREDLYYRLNVFHVHLPPLRERKMDIQPIAEALMADLNRKHDCRVAGITPEVLESFERHSWPGNVRELRNVLERAVILAGEGMIELNHLPAFLRARTATAAAGAAPGAVAAAPSATPAPAASEEGVLHLHVGTTVEEAEKGLILRTLEHTRNNKTRAAEILGISLKTLHNKLKEYGAGNGS